jgi:hypothetical protein
MQETGFTLHLQGTVRNRIIFGADLVPSPRLRMQTLFKGIVSRKFAMPSLVPLES